MAETTALPLLIARNAETQCELLPGLANRHGLITGATGTGKTVTLQVLAQALSQIGVPVFMADVKGDLSGMAKAGAPNPKLKARLDALNLPEPAWAGCPVGGRGCWPDPNARPRPSSGAGGDQVPARCWAARRR
jgi:hypothetical protein